MDIQHNDTQYNGIWLSYIQKCDTHHNDTQQNDTCNNDTQHNDTHYNDIQYLYIQQYDTITTHSEMTLATITFFNMVFSIRTLTQVTLSIMTSIPTFTITTASIRTRYNDSHQNATAENDNY